MGNLIIAFVVSVAMTAVIFFGYVNHLNLALVFALVVGLGLLLDVGAQPLINYMRRGESTGEFVRAIHLVHPVTGNSLCGGMRNSGVGFADAPGVSVRVITCKKCRRLARN
ncbi:hypothetical protein [Janthinobacterium sp. Ant5-2-1]|uniref:hypothetical protein n=1 Tax=Janthinobacterium sp. Ant5-2-1 TaxID=1755239 RepID=UPI00128F37A6|nr:hypothetical protein [Janthinobacterium sp. Ant5-2-1]